MPEYGEPLSEREIEILGMVATGVTNREVAYRLSISVNTVKVHLRNIFTKLGAESRTEATMIAVQEGWVAVDSAGGPAGPQDESAVGSPQAQPVVPEPPLSWFKRAVLMAALLLAVASIGVTWPRSRPQAETEPGLPLDRPEGQSAAIRFESEESSWRERAQMPTRRAHLAVAAVEGRIFAVAGQIPGETPTAAVEIYDPNQDIWTRGSDKPTAVTYVSASVIGTDVYVPGGCAATGAPVSVVEVYDTAGDSWREASPLPSPRCAYALAALDEKLYLFGGWDGERYVSTVYVYDSQADVWAEGASMPVERGFMAASSLNDRIYVVGGYDGEQELTACEAYTPTLEMWGSCAPLAIGRGGLKLVGLGGQLYAVGGGGWTSYLGFNERYNPVADTWTPIETPLVGEWRGPGVVVLDTAIYAIGGWSEGYQSLTQVFEALPFRIFVPVSHQE